MAKVTQPLGCSEARGSVGGFTYNTWRGIRTVKARPGPPHPVSQVQADMLALGSAAAKRWATLTDAQRHSWNDFANTHPDTQWTGTPQRITAQNWYIRINVRRTLLGNTPWDWPPPNTLTIIILNPDVHLDGSQPEITWDLWPDADPGARVECYIAGPHSAGITATLHDATRDGFNAYDAQVYNVNRFCPPGWYTLFFRIIHMTGLVGTWHSARILQT